MTTEGGTGSAGIVFSLDPNGFPPSYDYTILHHFADGSVPNDGEEPYGGLISGGGTLYGMTSLGGSYGLGTVFSMKPDGTGYTILHDFSYFLSVPPDGAAPLGSLVSDGSALYGMTSYGGPALFFPYFPGFGTFFSLSTDGSDFRLIHGFTPPLDGVFPQDSVISDGSALYGMTDYGGLYGEGVIFSYPLPTPTPTQIPLNYINLAASAPADGAVQPVTLSWQCDFSTWDYHGVPVDIWLALVRDPAVSGEPSSIAETLAGGDVMFFADRLRSVYFGSPGEPTWSNVSFPPVKTSNAIVINLPRLAGEYAFAVVFRYTGPTHFVRDDGLPVENSNLFSIK